jgi:hypothetical protein
MISNSVCTWLISCLVLYALNYNSRLLLNISQDLLVNYMSPFCSATESQVPLLLETAQPRG